MSYPGADETVTGYNIMNGVTTTYRYNNGTLLSQTTGDETIYYYYDSTGKPVSTSYQKNNNAGVVL